MVPDRTVTRMFMLLRPVWTIRRGLDNVTDLHRAGKADVADIGRHTVGATPCHGAGIARLVDPFKHPPGADVPG